MECRNARDIFDQIFQMRSVHTSITIENVQLCLLIK